MSSLFSDMISSDRNTQKTNTAKFRCSTRSPASGDTRKVESMAFGKIRVPVPETAKTVTKPPDCEKCGDEGYVFCMKNGFSYIKKCNCLIKRRQKKIWEHSGFANIDINQKLTVHSENYFKNFDAIRSSKRNWIIFSGRTGCGKTTQAGLIARNLAFRENPIVSRIVSFFDVLREFGGLWRSFDQDKFNRSIDEMLDVELVVLDDFLKGTKTGRGDDYDVVCYLVDRLYRMKMPTIITTESRIKSLFEFDAATAGRIVEMCDGRIVEYEETAVNYRMKRS